MENLETDGCKKVQYTSEQFALEDIIRIRKQSNRSRIPLRAYYCDKCNFWHLTSKADSSAEQISTLQQKLLEAEKTIKELKQSVRECEQRSILSKGERKELKREKVIAEKDAQIKSLRETEKKLRSDISTLIAKNIQLNNKSSDVGS
jgi:chromosome segregation ATPase